MVPTEAVSERALCALVGELSARPLAGDRSPWNLDLRVLAYGDSVDFGLMASPERVPDAVEIAMGIDCAVADLVKRSFEEREGALELAGGGAAR